MTLRETLGRIAKAAVPPNEEAAKFQIIVPVLGDLGWDVHNREGADEVLFEHSAGGSRGGGRVDIALMGKHDQCACFVEAKAPGVNLGDHVAQLLGYAFHDGVTVCALTDGLEWRLYLPREAGPPEKRQFARLRLREDPVEQSADDLEAFLSRDAVRSGKAERDAAKVLRRLQEESDIARRLPEIWRKMLTKPDEELVDLIRSKVYAELRLSPSAEQVAAVLSGRGYPEPTNPVVNPPKPEPNVKKAVSQKPTGATVFGIYKELRDWTVVLVFVAEQVYNRHEPDFLEKAAQLKGTKYHYVSKDTSTMRKASRPREIGSSGVFVDVDWPGEDCVRLSHKLLELFGYPISDLQIHKGVSPNQTDRRSREEHSNGSKRNFSTY